jgi:addiction module RelB/DinJ family antitoxin
MNKKTKLQLHIDIDAAEKSNEILESLGITLHDAVNMFLHQVRIKRGLPFEVRQEGAGFHSHLCAFCPVNDPIPSLSVSTNNLHGKVYKSSEEMLKDLPPADLPLAKKANTTPIKKKPRK